MNISGEPYHWFSANGCGRKQLAESTKLEWKPVGSRYQIIAPHTPSDMLDEAQQQQNCLAGYIQRVTNGDEKIFFLRSSKEEDKDKSIVTIELYNNGKIGQVRGRNNKLPEKEEEGFVRKWADAFGLEYPDVPEQMHA